MRWPEGLVRWPGPEGPSTLEREGGVSGGETAGSRQALRTRVDRREHGRGGNEAAGPRGTSTLVSRSGRAREMVMTVESLRARAGGWWR